MSIMGRYKSACLSVMLVAFGTCVDTQLPFPSLSKKPEKVTLLLPLTGNTKKISEAIRDGFLEANRFLNHPLKIKVIDSQSDRNIRIAYQKALKSSPDLIVGPLLKDEVTQLALTSNLSIPVLTLNYLEPKIETPANFYQFGLSPWHEMALLIKHANSKAYKQALILSASNDWGQSLGRFTQAQWYEQSEQQAPIVYYSDKRDLMQQKLRASLKTRDPGAWDVIFLLANAEHTRQIKPFINLYHRKNTPVYAPASAYDSQNANHLDRDLEGLMICDTPWNLKKNDVQSLIKSKCIEQVGETKFSLYARYYGLGVDACLLALRLVDLDQDSLQTVEGASGLLSLDEHRVIQRQAALAIFKHGKPTLLETNTEAIN